MQKIIVPTDFSENAFQAAVCAAGIAVKCGATVYLLHAMDRATDPILEPLALDDTYLEKYNREQFQRLRSVKRRIGGQDHRLNTELRLAKGLAADAILDFSAREHADLIVMGVHGSGNVKELLFGSVTADVIARSKIPVIAVPSDYSFHPPEVLLLAMRKFERDLLLLRVPVLLARTFKARIEILTFAREGEGRGTERPDTTRELTGFLDYVQQVLPDIRFSAHRLEGDDFQASLGRYCDEHQVGMVMLFQHPKSFFEKLCRGNNAKRAVFHSHVPVLVLPGD